MQNSDLANVDRGNFTRGPAPISQTFFPAHVSIADNGSFSSTRVLFSGLASLLREALVLSASNVPHLVAYLPASRLRHGACFVRTASGYAELLEALKTLQGM